MSTSSAACSNSPSRARSEANSPPTLPFDAPVHMIELLATHSTPALPLREGRHSPSRKRQRMRGVTTPGSFLGEVVPPPRKSLPLRGIDLSALPQGEGWEFVAAPASSR